MSLDDYAESSQFEPQPGWRLLHAIHEAGFTGEIRFSTAPSVLAYADTGTIYYAEQADDSSIGQRLVGQGVITSEQLRKGAVRVGDDEHLGRLFDREPSVDRESVIAFVETATATLISDIAALPGAGITLSAYRHHPSGVHRWFAVPGGPTPFQAVNGTAQVDRSFFDELPDVEEVETKLRIEWNDPGPGHGAAVPRPGNDGVADRAREVDFDVQAELDRFDADRADWSYGLGRPPFALDADSSDRPQPGPDKPVTSDRPSDEFQITWPDGTQEQPTELLMRRALGLDNTTTSSEAQAERRRPAPLSAPPSDPSARVPKATSPSVGLAPPDPSDVPEDVADAVRRALQAIEVAAGDTGLRAASDAATTVPAPPAPPDSFQAKEVIAPRAAGFAPPTPDMRAEVVYGRSATVETPHTDVARQGASSEGRSRRGALRRLIGSLRKAD